LPRPLFCVLLAPTRAEELAAVAELLNWCGVFRRLHPREVFGATARHYWLWRDFRDDPRRYPEAQHDGTLPVNIGVGVLFAMIRASRLAGEVETTTKRKLGQQSRVRPVNIGVGALFAMLRA
jgi:hypothetical protein